MTQPSSPYAVPGSGHITGNPLSSRYNDTLGENLNFLKEDFKELLNLSMGSDEKKLKKFDKELKKLKTFIPNVENELAKFYVEKLASSTGFNSQDHDFDKIFKSDDSRRLFLDALKENVKNEVRDKFNNEARGKFLIGGDLEAFEILKNKSPIFDPSKQNDNIKNYARQALDELSKLPQNRDHKDFLKKLKQEFESLESQSVDSMMVRSTISQKANGLTREIRKTFQQDNEFLKNLNKEHLSFEREDTIEKLIEIQKRLDQYEPFFADSNSQSRGSEARSSSQTSVLSRASSFSVRRTSGSAMSKVSADRSYSGDGFEAINIYKEVKNLMAKIIKTNPEVETAIEEYKSQSQSGYSFVKPTAKKSNVEMLLEQLTRDEKTQLLNKLTNEGTTISLSSDQQFSSTRQASEGPSSITRVLSTREASLRSQTPDSQNSVGSSL
jgi:hypothetical protein